MDIQKKLNTAMIIKHGENVKKQMKIVNFTLLHVAHGRAHLTATVYTPTCFDVGFYLCIIILLIYYLLLFIIYYLLFIYILFIVDYR